MKTNEFSDFVRSRPLLVGLIIFLSASMRIAFWALINLERVGGDARTRYLPTAINIIDGHGISIATNAPFVPSEAAPPLYPIFVAGLYWLFGRDVSIVVAAQIGLDLVTCFLVGFISFYLAPRRLSHGAAVAAMVIYGLFCWFCIILTVQVMTESLTIFLTISTIALAVYSFRHPSKYLWAFTGATCGLAIMARSDSVLVAGSLVLWLLILIVSSRLSFVSVAFFCLGVFVALTPWTVRNYIAFSKFQPLHSEWGFAQETYMPLGYLYWIKTWNADDRYTGELYNQAFFPGTVPFDTVNLPDAIFDSAEEKQRVTAIMETYNKTLYFNEQISDSFRSVADERVDRNPVRYYVALPLERVSLMWMTGFHDRHVTLRILAAIPILTFGLFGLLLSIRRSHLAVLLLLVIGIRSIFFGFHYAPEPRYIVEVYPAMVALAGLGLAISYHRLWSKLVHFWQGTNR
jgi:hypothetical protein